MDRQPSPQIKHIVVAKLYIYGNTKLLIDENNVIYHYNDHVPIGFISKKTNNVEFYYETQDEYNIARIDNNIIINRLSDYWFKKL